MAGAAPDAVGGAGVRTPRRGTVLVKGRTAALRDMRGASTYSVARRAQLAWVLAAGVELDPLNIRVDAIAPILVDNPTHFPTAVRQNPKFQECVAREVPLARPVVACEEAL